MRVLILGGTAWLGRHIAQAAVDAGHTVACLARGKSGATVSGVKFIEADRDDKGAYDGVRDIKWDVVVDVSSTPRHVRSAAHSLYRRTDHYVYVSSVSVYVDSKHPYADETAPVVEPLESDSYIEPSDYGAAKMACERTIREKFGEQNSAILRVGLIAGPGDPTSRTTYWPWRFAHPADDIDEAVLLPACDGLATQQIDVRDAADFIVKVSQVRFSGTVNLVGQLLPLETYFSIARSVAGHEGRVVHVPAGWLHDHKVQPWQGARSFPIWTPGADYVGFSRRDDTLALGLGLVRRSLSETLCDGLNWQRKQPGRPQTCGLADAQERTLLMMWDATRKRSRRH